MDGGSGAAAVAAVCAVVGFVVRLAYYVDRATRRPAPRRAPPKPPERWHEAPRGFEGPQRGPTRRTPINARATLRAFRGQSGAPAGPLPPRAAEPEDERPSRIAVPQRAFVRAARLVAATQMASPSMLQRQLGLDRATVETVMLGLEGAGVIGPQHGPGLAPVLLRPGDLDALFTRFGIVEDALPPDAGQL